MATMPITPPLQRRILCWLLVAVIVDARRAVVPLRNLQADDINSDIPEAVTFTIDNVEKEVVSGDVCEIGCEGDYSNIYDLIDSSPQEYELFFFVQGRYAVAAGVIYDNFPDRVQNLRHEHPQVDTIILIECPGSANDDASLAGGKLAHELGFQTCVPSDGHTASGGTDFFTSGVRRYATPGARLGIHSWAGSDASGQEVDGSDFPRDSPEHTPYTRYYEAVCIPVDFYWQTLSHGVEPMYYLTENDYTETFPYLRDCGGACNMTNTDTNGESSASSDNTEDSSTLRRQESLLFLPLGAVALLLW